MREEAANFLHATFNWLFSVFVYPSSGIDASIVFGMACKDLGIKKNRP
jgi:hypothetical protein